MSSRQGPVVVGVDDSPGAEGALRWAMGEAVSRDAPVYLVCAFRWTVTHRVPGFLETAELAPEQDRKVAEQLLANAIDQAGKLAEGMEVTGTAIDGDAVPVLIAESTRASLLVLGSRRLEALGAVVVGSVSSGVAARASCPVVVVRGPAGEPAERPDVVVGVDATEASMAVLKFGFDYASQHHLPLRAILCWPRDLLASMSWRREPPAPARAEVWLSETLAGWRENFPDVIVRSDVIRDHPVAGLVASSMAQNLLVVGSRGRHALSGTLLGSVSQGVLHHATCPVAVVPTHAG
jgi:nucleotide-binding universal stress UspA family protein